jgi:hypothetical protein
MEWYPSVRMSEGRSRIGSSLLGCVAVFAAAGATTASAQGVGWSSPIVVGLFAVTLLCLIGAMWAYDVWLHTRRHWLSWRWSRPTRHLSNTWAYPVRRRWKHEAHLAASVCVNMADRLDRFIRTRQSRRRRIYPTDRLTAFDNETLTLYENEFQYSLLTLCDELKWFDVDVFRIHIEISHPTSLTNDSDLPPLLRKTAYQLRRMGRSRSRFRGGAPSFRSRD